MRKTIAKFFIVAGLFMATIQTTNADCTKASGKSNNGGCQTSKDGGGYDLYTCIQGNFWMYGNCNVGASSTITTEN